MEKVIVLSDVGLGGKDNALALKMMRGLLKILGQKQDWQPKAIFFLGEAVRLLAGEHDLLGLLSVLEGRGIELLACRAAAEELQLVGQLKIGKLSSTGTLVDLISNYEIISL